MVESSINRPNQWFGAILTSLSLATALVVASVAPVQAQAGVVTGTVTDRSGQPLGSVQVTMPGVGRSLLTDARGRFVIRGLPAGTYPIQVQRIGYRSETQQVTIPAMGTVEANFQLSVSAVSLDEVVVTGTGGATERRKLGAAIASVSVADVTENVQVASLGATLQARIPGVRSIGTAGGVGSSKDLRIRGTSSFQLGQRPIVYVDGVRIDRKQSQFWDNSMGTACCGIDGGAGGDRLDDLNPEDIERIEVIKGPAAATLYGSEASNGVIQIFTKKGRAGSAPRWGLSYSAGFNRLRENLPTRYYPRFRGRDPDSTATTNGPLTGQVAYDANETLIENGLYQDANLTVQGGGEALAYFVGAGLLFEEGSIKPNDETRGNLRVNLNWQVSDKWTFDVQSMYTRNVTTLLQSGNNWTSIMQVIVGNPRSATAARPYGEPWTAITDVKKLEANSSVDRWTGGVTINFTPFQRFSHRLTVGLDQVSDEINKFFPYGASYVYVGTDAEKDLGYRSFKSATFDYLGRLSFDLPAGIGSELSFGTQGFWEEERQNMSIGQDYAGPGISLVSGGSKTLGAETFRKTVNVGIYAQNRFSVADRLFFTGGFRLDGNSAFGEDYGFQFYPKGDVAYVLSEEGFLPGFISNLKLRGAVGMSGLTPGAFDQFRTFSSLTVLDDNTGVVPDSPGNLKLGPERTLGLEAGIEAGFFHDRLGIDFGVYQNDTRDALLNISLPASRGFNAAQLQNVGKLRNRGWELSLNAAIIDAGKIRWSSTVAMDGNQNRVLELGPQATCGVSPADGLEYCKLGNIRTRYPVGVMFDRVITGDTALTSGPTAANLWGRNHTRSDTTVYRGQPFPSWNGSLGNTVEFGKLRLYGLVSWEKGATLSDGDRPYMTRQGGGDEYLSRFDFSQDPPARTAAADSVYNYWNLVSAYSPRDHIRIRELSLSYELPTGLIGAFGLGRTTLTVAAQNLYWWDDCHCRDPNMAYRGGADFGFASGFLAMPQPRKFLATLRTSF